MKEQSKQVTIELGFCTSNEKVNVRNLDKESQGYLNDEEPL